MRPSDRVAGVSDLLLPPRTACQHPVSPRGPAQVDGIR
jgi:hypothetical protein